MNSVHTVQKTVTCPAVIGKAELEKKETDAPNLVAFSPIFTPKYSRLCCGSNSTVKSRPSDVFLDDSKTHAEYNRFQSGSLDSGYQALHYSLDSLDDRYQYKRGWNRTRIVLKYQDIHTETNERSKSETGFFKATLVYCPFVSEVQHMSLGLRDN